MTCHLGAGRTGRKRPGGREFQFRFGFLFLAATACLSGIAEAALYSWQDQNGVLSYTDDLTNIPKKFRRSVRKVEGDEGAPAAVIEDKTAEAPQKQEKPPPDRPARIEGKTALGSKDGVSYYFDRTRVVQSGRGATLQYAFGILAVDEKSGEQKNGSLNAFCAGQESVMRTVTLPGEYVQALKNSFCSRGAAEETTK